jgi:hypothetical protein
VLGDSLGGGDGPKSNASNIMVDFAMAASQKDLVHISTTPTAAEKALPYLLYLFNGHVSPKRPDD